MGKRRLMFYRTAADVVEFGAPVRDGGVQAVAFDLGGLAELRSRGAEPIFAPDLLRRQVRLEVWNAAEAVSRAWNLTLGSAFDGLFGGLTLRDLFSYEAGYFGREAAASRYLIERVLDDTRPAELVLCQRPEHPESWVFYPFVFEALALDAAARRRLPVRFAPAGYSGRQPGLRRAWYGFRSTAPGYRLRRAKGSLGALGARMRDEWAGRDLQNLTAADLASEMGSGRVLLFGNQVDIQNSLHLAANLAAYNLELVAGSFYYQPEVAEQARTLSVKYLVHTQFGASGDRASVMPRLRQAQGQFLTLARRQEPPCPDIYGSERLVRSHFNYLFRERCYELALARPAIGRMLNAVRPSAVVLGLDWHHIPRLVVEEARWRGIPTLTLAHAGLMDWTLFGFASDRIAAWGEAHARRMKPADAVSQVGSARYDRFIAETQLEGKERLRARARALMADKGVDLSRGVVLVLTASEPEALIGPVDMGRHGQALEELLQAPARCPDVGLVFKPHPRFDYFSWYEALARQARPGVKFLSRDLALNSLLPGADAVLLVDVPSDGALEAMLYGIPTLFLSAAWDDTFDSSFNRAPAGVCEALTVRDMADVGTALRGALEPGEARDRLLAANSAFLRFWIGPSDGRATERTAALIAETAGTARGGGYLR